LAVVHDKNVDIKFRVMAAEAAMPYVAHRQGIKWEDAAPEDKVLIVIEGFASNSVTVSSGQEPRPDAPGPDNHGPHDTLQ
jgi:hypothetical protein